MVFGSHTSTEEMEEFAKVQERLGLTALVERRSSTVGPPVIANNKEGESVMVEHVVA